MDNIYGINRRIINIQEEESIIEEALKKINSGESIGRPKKNPPGPPDFSVDWKYSGEIKKLWIEITTIPYADNKTENKFNNPSDGISNEITQKIEALYGESDWNLVHLTIILNDPSLI